MEIRDFTELTNFVDSELEKMTESMGIQKPSTKFIEYRENTILKYVGLYDGFLFDLEKRKVRIQKAIATMPHGKIWKFFHRGLWSIIKDMKNDDPLPTKTTDNDSEKVLYPEVIKSQSLPSIDSDTF